MELPSRESARPPERDFLCSGTMPGFNLRSAPVLGILLFCFTARAAAGTVTYIASGGDWGAAGNWDSGEPNQSDQAEIIHGATVELSQPGERAKGVDLHGGSTLNIVGGHLEFGNLPFVIGVGSSGVVNHLSGTILGSGGNSDLILGETGIYNVSGGHLNLDDDVLLSPGSVFTIAGDATVEVDDNFEFVGDASSAPATLMITTTGDMQPTFNIDGDLLLEGNTTLEISADQGSPASPLFQVAGDVVGTFAEVRLNGVPLAENDYGFDQSGTFRVNVPEPGGFVIALCLCLLFGVIRVLDFRHRPTNEGIVACVHTR